MSALGRKQIIFCNLAISLVVLGMIISIVSIYFEKKILAVQRDVKETESIQYYVKTWKEVALEHQARTITDNFKYLLKRDNPLFNEITNKSIRIVELAWKPQTFEFVLFDIKKINNPKLNEKYNIDQFEKDTLETYEFLKSINFYEKWATRKNGIDFSTVDETKVNELLTKAENYNLQILLYFNDLDDINTKELERLNNLIKYYSDLSSRLIFIAFIFQLITFFIAQFFELRERG